MIYAYIRVSTDRQSVENQRYEISCFCEKHNVSIDKWMQETISGTRGIRKRKLGTLLRVVRNGDLIICSELSRLGRNMFVIMTILQDCMEKGCRVWTVKEGYRLGNDLQSKVLAFAFGMAADIERQFISDRTREALARKKAEGVRLGRPVGSTTAIIRLDGHRVYIQQLLRDGYTKRAIAKKMGCSRNTLYRWMRSADIRL